MRLQKVTYNIIEMVNKNTKNQKPRVKGDRNGRISKHHPKNITKKNGGKKTSQKKVEEKVVLNANQLQWKTVDIPDTMDDFGGVLRIGGN